MTQFYAYKIAAGYNNAAGFVNIEAITPTGDRNFAPPQAYAGFSPGVLRVRADGLRYVAGFQTIIWQFSVLTAAQWRYLMDTYSTGGNSYSGKVTISSRGVDDAYASYNAIINIPPLPELESGRKWKNYRDVVIRFTRAVAI